MSERGSEIKGEDMRRAQLMERVSRSPVGRILTPAEWHATDTHASEVHNWSNARGNPRWFQHGPLAVVPNFFDRAHVLAANSHEIAELEEEHGGVLAGAFRVGETAVVAAAFSPPEDAINPQAAFRIGPKELDATIGVLNREENRFVGAEITTIVQTQVPIKELPQIHPRAVLL